MLRPGNLWNMPARQPSKSSRASVRRAKRFPAHLLRLNTSRKIIDIIISIRQMFSHQMRIDKIIKTMGRIPHKSPKESIALLIANCDTWEGFRISENPERRERNDFRSWKWASNHSGTSRSSRQRGWILDRDPSVEHRWILRSWWRFQFSTSFPSLPFSTHSWNPMICSWWWWSVHGAGENLDSGSRTDARNSRKL